MTQVVTVGLAGRAYDIHIGAGLLASLGEGMQAVVSPSGIAVISDDNVIGHYGVRLEGALSAVGFHSGFVTYEHGERSKNLDTVGTLYEGMFNLGLDRKACVVALGGGVCGDMAGYAAATFLRGIPFVQVPTSLLAMVDSSSGGKTGVNHPRGKNLIGAFHQPRLVWIDPTVLQTLPRAELRNGLAEVVKHGVIRDPAYFALVESEAARILNLDMDLLSEVIAGSCRIKSAVVVADEREAGERAHLNFGHTFAHAYESLSDLSIPHGEAVAMGMIAACHLGELLGLVDRAVRDRITAVLNRLELPVCAPTFDPTQVLHSMYGDKKTERGHLRFVLPREIGVVEIVPVDDTALVLQAISATAGTTA